ncbi:MAG: ABC transporter ATP-binding protein/permease [Clostridiales bacterium]|nr:ABC transporter ATP-binding protein/permease [Clostridiales bacterium]
MARNKFDIDETLEKDAEFNLKSLMRLRKYIAPYTPLIAQTGVVTLISSLAGLAMPYIFKIAIDEALPPNNSNIPLIIALSVAMLALNWLSALLLRKKILTMSRVGQGIIRDLRLALFEHLQRLPFSYYDSRPHGKILVRVVNYINSLSDMVSNGLINTLTDLFSLFVIIIIMISLDARMALVAMAGLPILVAVTYFIKINQREAWRENSAKQSNMNAYIHESIAGMKVTQSFAREEYNANIFKSVTGLVRKTWLRACKIQFLMWPSAENISVWCTSFMYIMGAGWIAGGTLTVGALVAFAGYIGRFWGPINNIANFYNSIMVNMTYLERVFEVLDEPVIVYDVPEARELPPIKGKVEFHNVTFAYDPGRPILKDVSFKCGQGDTIALVGPTGAGKTTVVNLISRFYNLNRGVITIDGENIHEVTLHSLRAQMGIMLQDSFIFSGAIMDNIRYAKLDATDEEVIAAAKAVRAHEFIMEMEDGYETEVNERGSRLSVGQRQLISFARTLLADPKILILDEATSSIDTRTEIALQKGLDELLKGRTAFVIAHRLSTIKNATAIMYISDGKISEVGTHDELISRPGLYKKLYDSQYAFLESA